MVLSPEFGAARGGKAASIEFSACRDASAVGDCLLHKALATMQTSLGNVQLIDWKKGYLEIVAQSGFKQEFLSCFERVTLFDPSACGRVLLQRTHVVIEDVMVDGAFAPFRDAAEGAGFRSVQSTPLQSSSGALIGVISTHWSFPFSPSVGHLTALRAMAELAANTIIQQRARAPLPPV